MAGTHCGVLPGLLECSTVNCRDLPERTWYSAWRAVTFTARRHLRGSSMHHIQPEGMLALSRCVREPWHYIHAGCHDRARLSHAPTAPASWRRGKAGRVQRRAPARQAAAIRAVPVGWLSDGGSGGPAAAWQRQGSRNKRAIVWSAHLRVERSLPAVTGAHLPQRHPAPPSTGTQLLPQRTALLFPRLRASGCSSLAGGTWSGGQRDKRHGRGELVARLLHPQALKLAA